MARTPIRLLNLCFMKLSSSDTYDQGIKSLILMIEEILCLFPDDQNANGIHVGIGIAYFFCFLGKRIKGLPIIADMKFEFMVWKGNQGNL